MLELIARDLKQTFDSKLVDELLEAYREAKRNFYLGGLRLAAVEGGRFCEAAFRMLEQQVSGGFTPLGKQINSDRIISASAQATTHADAIRLHIPRALRVIYDIRNKRDAAHLADGIDPNMQDATMVAAMLDWIVAELIRLYHGVTADEAQRIINDLVARKAPAVQDFDGFLKILNPELEVGDRILLLLYERGGKGVKLDELKAWVHPRMRKNIGRALDRLEHECAFIHARSNIFQITNSGIQEVERKKLHDVKWL